MNPPATSIDIRAREKWNPTGIMVSTGKRYSLRAEGIWIDGGIRADANGFSSDDAPAISRWLLRATESKRRLPSERWFCLIGTIGRDPRRAFRIGTLLPEWVADGPGGELFCFANDVGFAYWNNEGSVRLTITSLP